MAQQQDSRRRIIVGAADLIRRRGLAGSTVRDLAEHAGAPLGSTYHYFPRGKQQLAAEAVRYSGAVQTRMLGRALAEGPVAGLRSYFALWRTILTDSGFRAGCPVLAVSIEEPPAEGEAEALAAAAEVFTAWRAQLADALREAGAPAARAGTIAGLVIAAVEGAIPMCRAQRDLGPLDDVAAELETLVAAALS